MRVGYSAVMPADATKPEANATVRLRVQVFDALTASQGAHTEMDRAHLIGIHLTTMYRIKLGQMTPRLDLAMRIADQLGVRVEDLFELVDADEDVA